MKSHLIIGSRGSKLALWQSEWVKAQLEELHDGLEVFIEIIKTSGDANLRAPLAVIGGKGVFTKELEEALLDERIDLAVHSLKDLPTVLPDRLSISAITEREDARDALILNPNLFIEKPSIKNLPQSAVVGTSSMRRMAQLKHLRRDLEIKDIRGNVDTRLRKLDEGEYQAIVLASAGLRRLGLSNRISAAIGTDEMIPAVGQGALGIETREGDVETNALLSSLNHAETRAACTAERALLRALGGGCQLPIAAHAMVNDGRLKIEGLVAAVSGEAVVRASTEGAASEAEAVGNELASILRRQGADSILKDLPA
ncbi:MAG: hydroxymethylbilane synthase [Acidobacteria bacterium 13_1_20CM_3_53_8]|nr:MAG: hydroxymethylbilane synthase [Acidobacteria bacterium 13_1_20CM_3_53_8]